MRDSQLLMSQLLGEYKCNSPILEEYLEEAKELLQHFANVIITHILKSFNETTNDLAQHASGYKLMAPDINSLEQANGVVATISQ